MSTVLKKYRFKVQIVQFALSIGLLCIAAANSLAAEIEAVRLWRAPDHTRLVLDLSDQADYKMFTLANPDRVVLDLKNSRLLADLKQVDIAGTSIQSLRGAKKPGNSYRLVIDTRVKVVPKVFALAANQQYGERLVIDLFDKEPGPTVVKTVEQHQGKRDLVIAIDAGHGGEDPGALGPRRIREKNVVLAIAKKVKRLFDAEQGYRAVLVRNGDYYVGLRKRRDIARQHQADLFVSIHADAFKDKKVSGSSVYTLSQRGASSASARFLADAENNADRIGGVDLSDKDDLLTSVLLDLSMTATLDASAKVARDILQEMGQVSKLHKRTVEHAGFAVLKSPDIPSVLVETGFISNPSEARRLSTKAHQEELADAIFEGVLSYYSRNATEGTWVHWNKKHGSGVAVASGQVRLYKIKKGDTLSEVALKNSVSLSRLRSYNKLKSDKIRVGQVIKIPPRT